MSEHEDGDVEEVKEQLHDIVQQLDDEDRAEFFTELAEDYCLGCGYEYEENEDISKHECPEEDEEEEDEEEEDDEGGEDEEGIDLDEEDDDVEDEEGS